jgi:hypothetical protein
MTTLAEAIAKCLAEGRCVQPLTDDDRVLLQRWDKALDRDHNQWQHISELFKNPNSLVHQTLCARHSARKDDESGCDSRAQQKQEEHKRLLGLAGMASALADYYREQQNCICVHAEDDKEAEKEFEQEYNRLEDLADSQTYQATAFRKAADALRLKPLVAVSQKTKGRKKDRNREQDLFLQHMSRWMILLHGTPHDLTVAEIASLVYEVQISKKTVEKQRDRMPKVTPPFSGKKP